MSKYRSLQFLRNETINSYASHQDAIEAIKGYSYTPEGGETVVVPSVLANVNANDGEIIMFRYKLDGDGNTVHTQLVAARATESTKYFEIIANYDQLTNIVEQLDANVTSERPTEGAYVTVNVVEKNGVITEVKVAENIDERIAEEIAKLDAEVTSTFTQTSTSQNVKVQVVEVDGVITGVSVSDNSINAGDLTTAIQALDSTVTNINTLEDAATTKDIKVTIDEVDGKLNSVTVVDTLAKVAHTGAAVDVAVADAGNLIEATTVEGALAEIAKEIDDMDSSLATTDAAQATKLVKLGYTQEDGKITSLTSDETALENRLKAIEDNKITGKKAIVVTPDTATGNNEVSLKLAADETVLSQTEAGLKSTISLSYDSATTTIYLKGIDGANLGTVDASNFVKDGLLSDVSIVTGDGAEHEDGQVLEKDKRYFKFIYKTVYYDENGTTVDSTKIIYLNVEQLVDSYSAGNGWIVFDQAANTISHKTVNGLDSENAHGIKADVTVDNTTEKSFKVPTLTVDAAGHVVSVDEQTVTIKLPASIDTAVQTINGHIENASFITTTVTPSNNNTVQDIAVTAKLGTFAANEADLVNGLATVQAVTDYVQANSTTVSDVADNPVFVVDTTNANGSKDYKVSLNALVTENEDVTNTMADNTPRHSYITSIETDGFGRVVKTVTETMTEDIECGYWDVQAEQTEQPEA